MSEFDDLMRAGFREVSEQIGCTVTKGAVSIDGIPTPFEIDEQPRPNGKRIMIDSAVDVELTDFLSLSVNEGDELTVDGRTVRLVRYTEERGYIKMFIGAPR